MLFFQSFLLYSLTLGLFWSTTLVISGDTSTSSWKSLVKQCNEAVHKDIGDVKDANSSIINCCTALWVSDCLQKKCQQGQTTLNECTSASLQKISKQTAKKYCDKLNLKKVDYDYCTSLPNKSNLGVIITAVIACALLVALVAVIICIIIKVANNKKPTEKKTEKKREEKKKSDRHKQSKAVSTVRPSALPGSRPSGSVVGTSGYSGASSSNAGSTSMASSSAMPSQSKAASTSMAASTSVAPGSSVKNSKVPMSSTFSGAKPNERPSNPMTKGKMASHEKESAKPSISTIRAGCKL